ncbi:MAG: hypothetical protein WDZ80_07465 [Candidatus Paceibacterota bacterium]
MSIIHELIFKITKLAGKVREHINTHRYQSILLDKANVWNQLCSSLDVIDDTKDAINSYLDIDHTKDTGTKYLSTYGILQALFIQQDALKNLSECFDIDFDKDQRLQKIRYLRNASVGHPTKLIRDKKSYYFHISRPSLKKEGFDLIQYDGSKSAKFIRVNILELIQDQLEVIVDKYRIVVNELIEIDQQHKEMFMGNNLQDIFHSGIDYSFQKVSSGIEASTGGDKEWGESNLKIIREAYNEFKNELSKRNELNDWTAHELNEYFHAISRIEEFYSDETDWITTTDAHIFVDYIRTNHKNFVTIAKEIDETYSE